MRTGRSAGESDMDGTGDDKQEQEVDPLGNWHFTNEMIFFFFS
jgi:hypothetical protein